MPDDKFNYQEQILNVACMLCTLYRELFVFGLNAALCGELEDLKHVFEDGEEYPGDIALLESLDDENIKVLLSAMYDIEEAGASLLNLNNIGEAKLNDALEEGVGSEFIPEYKETEKMDYHFWIYEVMGYIHFSVFNLLTFCYSLSHGVNDVPKEDEDKLYFPTDEALEVISNTDTNVSLIIGLALKLSDSANELCDRNARS